MLDVSCADMDCWHTHNRCCVLVYKQFDLDQRDIGASGCELIRKISCDLPFPSRVVVVLNYYRGRAMEKVHVVACMSEPLEAFYMPASNA